MGMEIDRNALKAAQATTITLLLLGFIFDNAWIVAVTALCQLLGAAGLSWAPFKLLYRYLYVPLRIVKPNRQPDHEAPHRFASLVGGIFNTAAALFLFFRIPAAGWILAWVVIILANLNFWLNFCAGCWMYYTFNRFGIPGFRYEKLS